MSAGSAPVWILASANPAKRSEFAAILAGSRLRLEGAGDYGISLPPETAATFVENALLKARYVAQTAGLPSMADDSGLAVDALDGAPGVRSARFAGEEASDSDNVDLLLERMRDLADDRRRAAFHCVIVAVRGADDPAPLVAHGVWHGFVARSARGGHGFGYDPVFIDPEFGRTAAELSPDLKNLVSHRGKALRFLKERIEDAG